jgi:hypothetical protein
MRRSTISGYQGPVDILTDEDIVVAQAACRYRAEEDAAGADHWQGRLHRIDPPNAIAPGRYRLRIAGTQHGEIAIPAVAPGSRVVYFDGIGRRPDRLASHVS